MKYEAGKGRLAYSNRVIVYVHNGFGHSWSKEISLVHRWWHLSSPAERIKRAEEKAARIAEQLNHKEMYINHEYELTERK